MSNGYTDVVIAQKACRLAGVDPVSSLDANDPDGDETQFVLEENYGIFKEEALTREYWRFASKQVQLTLSASTPAGRWSYAYELPDTSECIDVQTVTVGGEPIEYDVFGRNIYCNYSEDNTLILDYTYPAPENEWSPKFVTAFVYQLAALIAIGVQERPDAFAAFENAAEQRFLKAAASDAMSHTNRSMPRGALTRRRGSFTGRLNRR